MVEIVGNRSDFVATGSIHWVEPVKTPILWNILSAQLRLITARLSGSAWKENILGNILRRGWRLGLRLGWARLNGSNMARVDGTRRLPLARVAARGPTVQDLQEARVSHLSVRSTWFLRQWVRMDELYAMEWSKLVFDNFENSAISQNTSVFWRTGLWYQLLVGETTGGGFETLRGDKTHCFISTNKKLTNTKSLIHSLSLSL